MQANSIQVEFVFSSAARKILRHSITVPEKTTLHAALMLCLSEPNCPAQLSQALQNSFPLGIWGQSAQPETVLADQNRIEIYRPLRVDPKIARRERFQKQGARSAGLFAKRRPGAKPGY